MPQTTPSAALNALIDAINADRVRTHSPLYGENDLPTSLNEHLHQAFGLHGLFPSQLDDAYLHAQLGQALDAQPARAYMNGFLGLPIDTDADRDTCLRFYRALIQAAFASQASQAVHDNLSRAPYNACSLAQVIWDQKLCLTRPDAFISATLLAYEQLCPACPALPPRAAIPELDDYLDLSRMVDHLLPPDANHNRAWQLFQTLGASVYYQGLRTRAPTRREREASELALHDGNVTLPGTALLAPPGQALDALLNSCTFQRWGRELAGAAEWDTSDEQAATHGALAELALCDTLWPVRQRKPGQILDFELFSAQNAGTPLSEIRLDLINSVQASLGCIPAIAELYGELLMRHFAPELLLENAPDDFAYQPDLLWATLRQGARALRSQGQPNDFYAAILASGQVDDNQAAAASEALKDTLATWAHANHLADTLPPWSARQWQHAYDHYLNAWDLEQLRELPDRIGEARWQLQQVGLDPEGRNADGHPHLHAYLDHGAGYRKQALPDASAEFDRAFNAWEQQARSTHAQMLLRCLRQLPQDDQDHLAQPPWSSYAITWPRYKGTGPIPSYGDSHAHQWRLETATGGVLIHVPGEQHDTRYELFPQQLAWRRHRSAALATEQPEAGLELVYADYNGSALPWNVANWPASRKLLQAPASEPLAALATAYAQSIALGNRDLLYWLCKGATPLEIAEQQRRSVSDWGYAWNLLKGTLPLLGCADVRNGSEAMTCGFDALGVLGEVLSVGGKLIRPLARLRGSLATAAKTSLGAGQRAARLWAEHPTLATAAQRHPYARRPWHSLEVLPGSERPPQVQMVPGQTPQAIAVDLAEDNLEPLAWGGLEDPLIVSRDSDTVDALINGVAYRYYPQNPASQARRIAQEPLLGGDWALEVDNPYRTSEATTALYFTPPANPAARPGWVQMLSRAFMTVRIEPAPIRFRPHDALADSVARVMVRDGKVVRQQDEVIAPRGRAAQHTTGRKVLEVLREEDLQTRLGVLAPPIYHRRITVDPVAEFWFGLPEDFTVSQVRQAARECPPLRLGGLARTIGDRRTLRGAVLPHPDGDWLIVEADSGVFYGAPYTPWAWQSAQLDALDHGPRPRQLPVAGRQTRRLLERIREDDMIMRYLMVSESYRLSAAMPHLQRDVDNVATLLRDWIDQTTRLPQAEQPNVFEELKHAMEYRRLDQTARNILTQSPAQDALAGLARGGVVGLNRKIIPDWHPLAARTGAEQEQIVDVLDQLLPATGTRTGYTRLPAAELMQAQGAERLRMHLGGANLAFARFTLGDDSVRLYYALSGGKNRRKVQLASSTADAQRAVTYIDARQHMEGKLPDPRFTDLPLLRRPDQLKVRSHYRHLDSERLIASTVSSELLPDPNQVKRIDVFTLFDTCRSCGGYVLPRLRLDYPRAGFTVTWLIEYPS